MGQEVRFYGPGLPRKGLVVQTPEGGKGTEAATNRYAATAAARNTLQISPTSRENTFTTVTSSWSLAESSIL
jgi:hypothetical protein